MDLKQIWNKTLNHGVLQKEEEWIPFCEELLKLKSRKNFLEIGVNSGATVFFLTHLFENGYGIDIEKHFRLDEVLSEKNNYTHIIGDSHLISTYNQIENLNIKFDLIFIDGFHSYESAKMDFIFYKNFLNENGIIAFHDIIYSKESELMDRTIYNFWEELKLKYEFQEYISLNNKTSYNPQIEWINTTNASLWGGVGILKNVK